jgi:hypothetical protein
MYFYYKKDNILNFYFKLKMAILIPSLKTLKNILFDEQKCINFLFENDILYRLETCSECDSRMNREKNIFRCINRECRKSVSIFKDSFFAKDHLKCSDTMLIGYLWLNKTSCISIINMTGYLPNTITNYMNFLEN